jgi:glycerophosphoryl diester phosphodiesterase
LLGRISQRSEIALVIFDSKVSGLSAPISEVAGQEVVRLIESHLFGSGYSGNVVVSAADLGSSAYLRAAALALQGKPFVDKVFLAFDQEGNRAAQVLAALRDLPSRARAFGTGTSACGLGDFRKGIRIADDNRSKGSASFVYIWTLDRVSSMQRYRRTGAQGIITNFPRRLRKVIEGEGGKLATRATSLPLSTSDEIIDSSR